jgi:DNA-binding CsgD family transcriptional regulator
MTLNNSRFNIPSSPLRSNYAPHKLNHLQADLASTARMWAVDEVGAAMAHQLNEPLTALLLYLHEIKQEGAHSTGANAGSISVRELVEKALRETERVCDIMDRLGHAVDAPADAETAVARGREAIDSWTRGSNAKANGYPLSVGPRSNQRGLTPREREVLALITGGSSNKEGGHQLGISTRTFEVHRAHIMEKLGAKNAADLVRMTLSEIG